MENRVSNNTFDNQTTYDQQSYGLFQKTHKGAETARQFFKENITEGFELGTAVGEGDCFYDAIAQGINQLRNTNQQDVKSLRRICDSYVKKLHQKCRDQQNHGDNWIGLQLTEDAYLRCGPASGKKGLNVKLSLLRETVGLITKRFCRYTLPAPF